jgi:O-antigen ligase
MGRLATFALWALLFLPLVASPLLGLLTPYVGLLVVIPVFFSGLMRGQFGAAYASWEARAFLAVFVILALAFAATADSVSDGLRAFNFTMLLAYGAIAWFMAQRAGQVSAERIAQLASIGVVIGLAEVALSIALPHIRYLHYDRPTGPDIGPIVLSNAVLALGFIGLGGALLRSDRKAWFYLLAPVLAIAATILTGSRGPLISVPFAILAAALWLWRMKFGASMRTALAGIAALAVIGAIGIAVLGRTRFGSVLGIAETLSGGGAVTDESTRQRLVLWRAGWTSFVESPWIGHGWGNIMDSVRPLLPPADADLATILPQLHNDVLNFAVGGGVVGVLCYLAIITAPLLGALLGPRDSLRPFRLYGATVLTIVYVGGGLTDLMFGFEFHTFLFVMLTAILLGFCRERRA